MAPKDKRARTLVCDDDALFRLAVRTALAAEHECLEACNGDEALAAIRSRSIDVVLLDVTMRTENEGLDYISRIKAADPDVEIVMSSGRTDFDTVRAAMREGARDYVPKDFEPNALRHVVRRVLDHRKLLLRASQQDGEVARTQKRHVLVGESPQIRELRRMIDRARGTRSTVLIQGETGTGKEVVARQLRFAREDGTLAPFVAVDSSTIQGSMAESVLFGHEKGAFTGADRLRKGVFEEADGGIVYFDEISNMPGEIQAKLLRVLQEREVVRLGSARPIELDFRVVCASNQDLETLVREGKFKADLFQRLDVIPILVPPLRDRAEDVPLLAEHFLSTHATPGRDFTFTAAALDTLRAYSWPGNVRELANLVAYSVAMADGPELDVADLPPRIREAAAGKTRERAAGATASDFYARVEGFERNILSEEYDRLGGNVSRMALELGMDRSHLHAKLRGYGIHEPRRPVR